MGSEEQRKTAEARLGRVLRGKYRLDRILGIGGMATVYAATHRNKKRFAIKMLHPERSARDGSRTRFLREGYVANSVGHPGAVAVIDDDVAEDGSAFLVMDLLEGSAVDELAEKHGGTLPLGLVLSIGDALLDVLAAAHAKGIVHRDLKPANLFLTNDGTLQVLDFGIARLHDATSDERNATQTGVMLGTPAFMAPEQALAEPSKIGAQTDLWAVGATLFILLTGELVHEGENVQQLLVGAATKKARAIASVSGNVPPAIAEVIDRSLAFERRDRWGSAAEMRAALAQACADATGTPVAPLPRTERVTGLEETIPSGDVARASSRMGAGPTVYGRASVPAGAGKLGTTAAATTLTKQGEPRSSPRAIAWKWIGAAAIACIAAAAGTGVYRAAHATRAHYCLNVVDTKDGPRCVFEVGADIVGKRWTAIDRVTERAGRSALVEHVNSAGVVAELGTEYARREVVRDEAGAVSDVITRDDFGVIVRWEKWSAEGARIDLVDIDGKTPRHLSAKSRVTTLRRAHDAQGREKRVRLFGPSGRPRTDNEAYGLDSEYAGASWMEGKVTILGADGLPAPGQFGITFIRHTYDGGPWGDQTHFDLNDRPIASRGAHLFRWLHNDYEETGASAFGLRGEPVVDLVQWFHELRKTWDPAKRTREWAVFDAEGRPGVFHGPWFTVLRETLDERGRLGLTEFLDSQGNRVAVRGGASATRYHHGEGPRADVVEALDPSGALTENEDGYARREMTRDAHGNILESRFFDHTGRAAPWKEGGAIQRSTYDDRDLTLTTTSFDPGGQPVANPHGFASEHDQYDRLRNLVEVAYFGPDAKPTGSDEGFAIKRMTYDENDDLVKVAYFDATGAPTPFDSSYASERLKNDERGLVVRDEYFDVHGEPALLKDGYSSVETVRDRSGDPVEEAYFGKHHEPVAREGGFARRKTIFDVTRRPIEVALFDPAGKRVVGSAGWAVEKTTYDARGVVIQIDHFDASMSPAIDRDGRASIARTLDARGNLTEETSLDPAGKPVVTPEGYATRKTTYDERDEPLEESLFDTAGTAAIGKAGWSLRRLRYDDFGDVTEEAFFDGAHEPVVPSGKSYASKRERFDERHRLVETGFFDARGALTKGPDGVSTVRYERDSYGRAVTTSYFDGMGTLAPSSGGRVIVHSVYDDAGHLVDEHFVDASGAPRIAVDGCAGHHTRYDALGHTIEESCLGTKGLPALSTGGWAIRRTLHDARGNDVEVATYAADDTLHSDKDGIARRKNRFDERNLLVETRFFDAGDKPAHDGRGAYGVRYTYDDRGKRSGESAFDERDRPVRGHD